MWLNIKPLVEYFHFIDARHYGVFIINTSIVSMTEKCKHIEVMIYYLDFDCVVVTDIFFSIIQQDVVYTKTGRFKITGC